jgi:hypothetical protein
MSRHEEPSRFLSIVREQIRPGCDADYDRNELQIADVSARLNCPHPYLALATVAGPPEVWWLNSFASEAEREGVASSYASNEPLMTALRPLGARKNEVRESLTSVTTEFRPDASGSGLRIAGARFLVVNAVAEGRVATGSVFQAGDGQQFEIAAAPDRDRADDLAAHAGPGATTLAVRPQWSFPAEAWIAADPEFWRDRAPSRGRRSG